MKSTIDFEIDPINFDYFRLDIKINNQYLYELSEDKKDRLLEIFELDLVEISNLMNMEISHQIALIQIFLDLIQEYYKVKNEKASINFIISYETFKILDLFF